MPPAITNIAGYKFVPLDDLKTHRAALRNRCSRLQLKGTILLSTEGINLFVAGSRKSVDTLVEYLRTIRGLENLLLKFSESAHQPFNRMLVRIKKEIIAFGVDGINPGRHTSPKLPPRVLKQWLDEGKAVTLLDTRNDYEVKLGTFAGAHATGIRHFRDFPTAVQRLPRELKETPVVMFCTGGIRCEKAGPYMEREGFKQVFQLDGGILKYFEEVGSDHYDGECFVFDQRVGVDPALRETSSAVCFNCQTPLTAEEQTHPHYQPPESCPHCFQTSAEQMAATIEQRHQALRQMACPLPGSQPYNNRRPLLIPSEQDGTTLLDGLCRIFPQHSPEHWAAECAQGRLLGPNQTPCSATHRVTAHEYYAHLQPATIEPDVSPDIRILHEDAAIVVLHKPAPLPMHPSGRFNRNTLEYLLAAIYAPRRLRPAHRLDANTTGLVVCTRTRRMAGRLQPQFARGEVEKTYLARVQGSPTIDEFSCDAPIGAAPAEAGSRVIDPENGLPATTTFEVIRRDRDGTTLLRVLPLTGRTNQIRAHLWHLGLPVCGDPVYLADGKLGTVQTLPCDAPPLCLHAWRIALNHPESGERVTFEDEPPLWAGLP